jgi:hypothetical protein
MAVINAELPASTGPLAAEGGQHLPKIQYCEVQVWELDSATGFATRKQYWALGSQSVNGTKTEPCVAACIPQWRQARTDQLKARDQKQHAHSIH